MVAARRSKLRKSALDAGFRSGLEQDNYNLLSDNGIGFSYEKVKIKWVSATHTYTPDFVLDNGIIIETKGRFFGSERSKHLAIKRQYPNLDLRFVFSKSNTKLKAGSKSTYGSWCKKHGFLFADETIPIEWMKEKSK